MARDNRTQRADEAGVGPDPRQSRHLTPLREAKGFRVARGEPDVRGWRVFASNGREIGSVSDVLVDTSRGEVIMLDVAVSESGTQALVPVRAAWVDRANQRVVLDAAELNGSNDLPLLGREASPESARANEGESSAVTGPHDEIVFPRQVTGGADRAASPLPPGGVTSDRSGDRPATGPDSAPPPEGGRF